MALDHLRGEERAIRRYILAYINPIAVAPDILTVVLPSAYWSILVIHSGSCEVVRFKSSLVGLALTQLVGLLKSDLADSVSHGKVETNPPVGLSLRSSLLAETTFMLHQEVRVGLVSYLEAQPLVERHRPGVHFQHSKSYRQAQTIPSTPRHHCLAVPIRRREQVTHFLDGVGKTAAPGSMPSTANLLRPGP